MSRRFSPSKFRDHRIALGLTRTELASDLGKSEWSVIGYELGRYIPPTNMLPFIAQRFGVTEADLFAEEVES